jgi:tetratricopeptide (TPR) repeat protein
VLDLIYHATFTQAFEEAIQTGKDPDFQGVKQTVISKGYRRDDADKIVIKAREAWYSYLVHKQHRAEYYAQLDSARIESFETFRPYLLVKGFAAAGINNIVWDEFFIHCNNSEQLNFAIKWMKVIVDADPKDGTYVDTYACLLYKAGHVQEALEWEQKAIEANPKDKGIAKDYQGIKEGRKIWAEL